MNFIHALAIRFRIANSCTTWSEEIFKGLSQDGGRADFSKNLRASIFNKGLSNEPNFGRIHLAGQYLVINGFLGSLVCMTESCNINSLVFVLIPTARRISFPTWQFISELPTAVRRGAKSLKGFHRMGNGHIFLKDSAPLSLTKAFRMSLISAGSTSLDSIFK
jgi:hypothetical protein